MRIFLTVLLLLIGVTARPATTQPNLVVIDCRPDEVASLSSRIHVHCTTGRNGVVYFALGVQRSAAEKEFAHRAMSLASGALVSGRSLSIRFDPNDQSGGAIGCLVTDCRLIHTIYLR
ncbi:MAG: hypothetical protein FJ206_11810 [Gemmatimonadetes bacterium]|nr:hypothetical protein [Gemmatimonadota bacterium]